MKSEFFLKALNYVDDKYIEEAEEKTMKKRFNFKPIIAIAACAALALAAVPLAKHFAGNPLGTQGTTATTQAPTPIVIGGNLTALFMNGALGDGSTGIPPEKETDFDGLWERYTDKTKLGTRHTVTVAGETYTGTYMNSTKSDYYGEDTDNYRVSGYIEFSINRQTGECTEFNNYGNLIKTEEKLSGEECALKAVEYFGGFIDDIEDYELTLIHETGASAGYLISFHRMIDGIQTRDSLYIQINYRGDVIGYSLYGFSDMKNIDLSGIKLTDIENAISAKVNAEYSGYDNIECSVKKMKFSRIANGKYAFVCEVSIEAFDPDRNIPYRNYVRMLVEVD